MRQQRSVARTVEPAIHWLFRDRRTGRITIAQWPNLQLVLFAAATLAEVAWAAADGVGTVLRWTAWGFLGWWAADELLRGVNPWRRLLGGGTLIYLMWVIARST